MRELSISGYNIISSGMTESQYVGIAGGVTSALMGTIVGSIFLLTNYWKQFYKF